jgi:pyruvyltransferase
LPLICNESKKEYDVGLVPHQIDYDWTVSQFPNYHVINLTTDDPIKTAKEITKCRRIISSSLHGIICAHSFGIPAAWISSHNRLKGDGIKFEDYYASINIVAELSTMENLIFTNPTIDFKQIEDIFKSLK